MKRFICGLIRLYQLARGRSLPHCCRFYPSCSDYALASVQRLGAIKGIIKTTGRVLRCHPFSAGGYDPAE
ncbi:MAG: membrane protein insertion efficiency factor YidD [Candidatus Omnitrophota bacterium]|nr:membrane protein insertion efficiency factor YidD [Candidatus Omnitrophota bacterium]